MNRFRFWIQLCLLLSFRLVSHGQSAPVINAQRAINTFIRDSLFRHASISFTAVNLTNGKTLATHQPDMSITPASTLKLLTTATALEVLGKDYKFQTLIEYDGDLDTNGHLKGNIYIIGKGDPTLGSRYFSDRNDFLTQWCKEIKKRGIKTIEGDIIADNNYFKGDIPRTWIWEDIANYYGSAAHSLSYKDNTFSLFFESGSVGSQTLIKRVEPNPKLRFENKVLSSARNRDEAYLFGGPQSPSRQIKGFIPHNRNNFEVKGAIPNPGDILISALKQKLDSIGIIISQHPKAIRNDQTSSLQRKILFTHYSPPLEQIVYFTNQKSINLFAEHLLKQLGKRKYNKGDNPNGVKAIESFWKHQGLETSSAFLHDGSGLSRFNAISSRLLTNVLKKMQQGENYSSFYNSLPNAGRSGTLKYFGTNSVLENNLRAKTGSMTGVRSYSGYMTSRRGIQIAFTIIINNYSCSSKNLTSKVEQLLIMLFNY